MKKFRVCSLEFVVLWVRQWV